MGKKAKYPNLAAALKKHEKVRNELLVKREALDKRETMRMAHKEALGRKNVQAELTQIRGKLASLRPGVASDVVKTLQAREKQLLQL